jgi:uncharacterized protein YjbJ (UPF0337 family)
MIQSLRTPATNIYKKVNSDQFFRSRSSILTTHQSFDWNEILRTPIAEDIMMKPSTQDQTEGKVHEVKGKIKEEVGKATGNSDLEVSGNAEKKAGKVQKWIGRAEKAVGG